MSAYEPGAVAVATVRGVPNVRIFRYHEGRTLRWDSGERVADSIVHSDHDVTDIRPLVVLDPDDTETLDRLVTLFHESWSGCEGARGIGLAGALRTLTKPPRIPEPSLYGVVSSEDDRGLTTYFWHSHGGWHGENGSLFEWDDLIAPTLIRPGIEDGAS